MRNFLFLAILATTNSAALALTSFSLPWVNHPTPGTQYSSTDHKNGIFVLEFLANFCGACNANAINVDELATAYSGQARVQVLDMSIDRNDREIATWIRNHQPNHPVLKDIDRLIWTQVGEQFIPTVVVVDCRGQEHFRYSGEWDSTTKTRIHEVINELLTVDCQP